MLSLYRIKYKSTLQDATFISYVQAENEEEAKNNYLNNNKDSLFLELIDIEPQAEENEWGFKVDLETIQSNKELIKKYPFLLPRNVWSGKPVEDFDFHYTELDSLPFGWKKAFGLQMVDELNEILKKGDYVELYRITDIKEKFGSLRWYDFGVPNTIFDEYNEWLNKYEKLSMDTCIECGKPSEYETKGWINFLCRDCAKKQGLDLRKDVYKLKRSKENK